MPNCISFEVLSRTIFLNENCKLSLKVTISLVVLLAQGCTKTVSETKNFSFCEIFSFKRTFLLYTCTVSFHITNRNNLQNWHRNLCPSTLWNLWIPLPNESGTSQTPLIYGFSIRVTAMRANQSDIDYIFMKPLTALQKVIAKVHWEIEEIVIWLAFNFGLP